MQLFIARASGPGFPGPRTLINRTKLVYIMRVSCICLFLSILSVQLLLAKSSIGQRLDETFITLQLKNSPLDAAFKKIEKSTDYRFAYQPRLVSAYEVTISRATRSLSATLELILKGTNLSFRQAGNSIIIYQKEDTKNAPFTADAERIAPPSDTTISGVIVNAETRQPLSNVSISVQGKKSGTTTDNNGHFTLTLHNLSGVLIISSVGYEVQQLPLDGRTSFSIALKVESKSMNDVVVIGYGTKKKIDLTGTVNSLEADEIVRSKATNAQEAMQGRLQGVDIKRSSGRPGADFTIEIRGANSITGSTQPLYVVDGIPTGNINDINPADIERIDVLKDASSTAIFGSRGANGVVIVTTKRGVKGTSKITYDAYVGAVDAYHLPPMMNGPQFVAYAREFWNTQAAFTGQPTPVADNKIFSATELSNIAKGTYTDWYKLIRRNNALQTNHNISITGGDDKTTYFLSMGFQFYNGAVQVENTKKYTLKVGMDKIFYNALKVGASIYSTYADINPGSAEVFRSAGRLRPTGSAYNADGSLRFFAYETESQITNPLFEFKNELRRAEYIRLLPNVFGELTIGKGLKFKTSFTPDITFQRAGVYDDTYTKANAGTKPSSGQNLASHWFNYTWDNVLTYNRQFGEHKFDLTLGNSLDYYQYDYNSISVVGLPYRSLWFNVGNLAAFTNSSGTTTQPSTTVASGYTQQNIASFFFRGNYTFKDRYLFTVTGRADGNSIFAPGHQWGYFPSGAFAWIASKEAFLQDISLIDLLKFRVSYGQSGNAATNYVQPGNISGVTPAATYLAPYITQSSVGGTYYDFNGANANGFSPSLLANKDLTWEKTTEYDAGVDLQILKRRIGLQLDFYNKTAKGTILSEAIPAANGFTSVVTNLGSIRNRGIEVGLNTVNFQSRKFSWTTSINFSVNQNKILDLYGNGTNDIVDALFIGQKARVVYQYKIIGVWQTSEAAQAAVYGQVPGQYKIQDINKDNKITAADRQVLGSDIPNWFGGITNTVNYANFDLGFTIYTRQGTYQQSTFLNQFLDGDQGRARFNAYERSYWTPTNPSNRWANNALETDANRRAASEYMNSSYTKVSNITLGYTFQKRLIGNSAIKNLRVYVDAFNPFIFTKFIGWDPETADLNSGGAQDFRTRTFMFGVNVGL